MSDKPITADNTHSLREELAALQASLNPKEKKPGHLAVITRIIEIQALLADIEYQGLSYSEKVTWWTEHTYKHMRWQAESNLDQLLIFDSAWLSQAKSKEPMIEEILKEACVNLKLPTNTISALTRHKLGSLGWKFHRFFVFNQDFV